MSPNFAAAVIATLVLLLAATGALAWRWRRRLTQQRRDLRAAIRDRDLILGNISDNVTFLDRNLRIVWTNWADRTTRPTTLRPAVGAVCHALIAGEAEPCPGCPAPEVLRTGLPSEGVVTCRDGSLLRLCAAPVRDERGALIGVVQTARDISEQRRLAERLHQSQKLEAVGQLAAGVAHDFNNSLQVILGYADLLSSLVPASSEARGMVAAMIRAGQQARDVVRQLLTFSRKREPRTEAIDLGVWLRDQADILRRLLGDRITVEVSVASRLPRVEVDAGQLEQALLNLCTNARDAMPEGGRLTLDLQERQLGPRDARLLGAPTAGRYVVLSVVDNGEGIAPELQDRIFDPFFTTKDVDRGTGLGLATVYGIVTAHGGYLELESQPGRGATFRLGWPVVRDAVEPPTGAERPSARVLVVDDDPGVREVATAVLAREGYTVEAAADGAAALERLLEPDAAIDVVVLDMMLAGCNGWTLLRQARLHRPDLVAVLCSREGHHAEQGEELPPVAGLAHLQKPYRASDLTNAVAVLLAGERASRRGMPGLF